MHLHCTGTSAHPKLYLAFIGFFCLVWHQGCFYWFLKLLNLSLRVRLCMCQLPLYVLRMCTVLKEARRGCQVPRSQKYRGHELSNVDTRNGSQGLCKSISLLNRLSHFSKAKMVLKWSSQDNSNEMISMKTIFQTHRWWPLNVRSMQRNNRGGELVPCRVCGSQGQPQSSWTELRETTGQMKET